jgi:hypothetical protein
MNNLSEQEISELPRGTVRYACFRNRSGNPDAEHLSILNWYIPRIERYGLSWDAFGDTWDISKTNNLDIMSGHQVFLIKEENKSLFNADGTLKE